MSPKLERLVKQNLDLFESGDFADVEIICYGRAWKVHKLILRSRCPWFNKAFSSNWKESQTSQFHLEEVDPEQLNDLLKFIYSGRFSPDLDPTVQCVSAPILESNVSLWCTADYFQLPDLKTEIQEYLIERSAATLYVLHEFVVSQRSYHAFNSSVFDEAELDAFFTDFSEAVEKAYGCPAARQLQKLFAVFTCGLREHLPAKVMWDLAQRIPEFQLDVSTVLTLLHFPNSTEESVADTLEKTFISAAGKPKGQRLKGDCIQLRCSGCGRKGQQLRDIGDFDGIELAFDPFSFGTRKWCPECAYPSIKSLMHVVISRWPARAPGSG